MNTTDDLTTRIIPITELRRNFGKFEELLPIVESLILTKKGKPFAVLKASKETKRGILKKTAGLWKGTELNNDKLWVEVRKKKSRKKAVVL